MKKIEKNEKNNHNKDPFEINLLQIKQTNDILNSIETKLNEVLSRSPQKVSNLPSASKYLLSPFSNRKKNILKENDNQNNFKLISERKKINEFQESQIFDNIGSRIYFDENQLEIDGRSLRAEDLKSKDELDEEVRKLKERLFLLERENELKQEELMTSKRQIESLKGNKNFEGFFFFKLLFIFFFKIKI